AGPRERRGCGRAGRSRLRLGPPPDAQGGSDRTCRPVSRPSRLVLELDTGDPDGVAWLHTLRLERLVDAEPVQLGLESREPAVGVEVEPVEQALDALPVDDKSRRL